MPEERDSPGIFRYALGIQYRGTYYCGWQRQEHRSESVVLDTEAVLSVQTWLEAALSQVADESIMTICAGRTDAGVHAKEQVIHFETTAARPLKAWVFGVNAHLPNDVSVLWAKQVDASFHARFTATARTYRYVINNSFYRPALGRELMTWERRPLDPALMHEAAQSLLGENDFSSFRGSSCQSKTPFRNVHHVHVCGAGRIVAIEIKANAFLHHMVRNIAGVLMKVGSGEKPVTWVRDVLLAKNRAAAGVTAHPNGLYLMKVDYPEVFGLPQQALKSLTQDGLLEGVLCGDFC
jgi:tRNA pseudouridine38-40 synthase